MAAMDCTVRAYSDEDREAFGRLHRHWLLDNDILEERDELDLADPVASYIDPGGAVFVAVRDGTLVASVAVTPFDDRSVELTKFAVDPEWQGRGLGRMLLDRVLDWARTRGAAPHRPHLEPPIGPRASNL
jgi:putative acetyltransferase